MKKIIILSFLSVLLATSCEKANIDFDTTMPLSKWYETAKNTEGNSYWNAIPYPLPSEAGITVSRLTIEDGTAMDFYFPAGGAPGAGSAVIIFPRIFKKTDEYNQFGKSILAMDYEISWAHLLAGQGYTVVKYETDSPVNALETVINFIVENSKPLGIDDKRIGLWSLSSNPKAVISLLALGNEDIVSRIRCSAFFSPELKTSGMTSFGSLHHVPYFIAVGLKDNPTGITLAKLFAENCKKAGLPYEYHEHPEGQHGFDALQDDEVTRAIIRACLEFFQKYLKTS